MLGRKVIVSAGFFTGIAQVCCCGLASGRSSGTRLRLLRADLAGLDSCSPANLPYVERASQSLPGIPKSWRGPKLNCEPAPTVSSSFLPI